MSSAPGGSKRRLGKQPEQAIDLTPSDASQAQKRSRAARAAAAAADVVDLTDEPAPSSRAGGRSRNRSRSAAAPAAAPAPASGSANRIASSRSARKAAGRAVRAAAAAAAAEAGAAAAEQEADMFFRSRNRAAAASPTAPAAAPVVPAATEAAKPGDELPSWHSMKGAKRLQTEFKYLNKQIAAGKITQVHDITPVDDNIFKWQFKLKDFDNDCEGGRDLNRDLSVLEALHGQDHLLMEIEFPKNYPNEPFFLRLVTPRCVWYTGHVTAGGSVCIEVLTQSGTPNSWSPAMCVESIMNTVILNMLHCESVMVRTATGPGGRSGPLRVDLQGRYAYNPMQAYSDHEARAAFSRMLSHHRSNGW